MASELAVLSEIAGSNIAPEQKTMIAQWANRVSGGKARQAIERLGMAGAVRVGGVVNSIRVGGEAVLTGGVLGAIHTQFSLDQKRVPLDAVAAGAALAGAAFFAGEEWATDLRNMGGAAAAVYGFRQAYKLISVAQIRKGEQPVGGFAGEFDNFRGSEDGSELGSGYDGESDFGADDPIVACARRL